jgi:hypothetical protein
MQHNHASMQATVSVWTAWLWCDLRSGPGLFSSRSSSAAQERSMLTDMAQDDHTPCACKHASGMTICSLVLSKNLQQLSTAGCTQAHRQLQVCARPPNTCKCASSDDRML